MHADPIAILSEDKERISYRPRLNEITGSVIATILLQQMLYWWWKSGRQPFYKFATACSHPLYKAGDSWQEELGISRAEFETALKKIGRKINRHSSKTEALGDALVLYWVGFDRVTYYEINEALLAEKLAEIYSTERNAGNSHYGSRNAGKSHYLMQDSSISYCENQALDRSETTQRLPEENIADAAKAAPPAPPASQKTSRKKPERTPEEQAYLDRKKAIETAYVEALGYKPSAFVQEAKAAKWLAEQGYTPEQVTGCLRHLQADDWYAGKHISLQSVAKQIGAWVQSNKPKPKPAAPETKYYQSQAHKYLQGDELRAAFDEATRKRARIRSVGEA